MRTLQFTATVVVTLFLMGFCLFLWQPTMELFGNAPADGLGPGVLPLACISGVFLLSLYTLARSALRYRASSPQERHGDGCCGGVPVRPYLCVSAVAIVLISGYAALWYMTHFAAASCVFSCVMAAFVMPPEKRTPPRLAKVSAGLIAFSLFVWLAFERLLNVALR